MAIDFFLYCFYSCGCACVCRFQRRVHTLLNSGCALYLHLHVWETEVKVTETKQAAFPLVTSAAAVTFCPGRLGPRPRPANLLHSII